mmetsp:Transcript_7597/g.16533  ORF Transcript_7597/g.16533 Transcript_7597/m.16533 type:complete len:474 (-) Transcript_7597:751-2172(-)
MLHIRGAARRLPRLGQQSRVRLLDRRHLQERIIRAVQDILGLLQRLDLVSASALSRFIVLHGPITLGVQFAVIFLVRSKLSGSVLVLHLQLLKLGTAICHLGCLLFDCLGVRGTLFLAVSHQALVILLRVLLAKLTLLHLLLQVVDHHVHQANNTATVRLLEAANFGRRLRGGSHLDEGIRLFHLLFLTQLGCFLLLVLLRGVELVQAVLGHPQQIQRGVVLSSLVDVRLVIGLSLLSSFLHSLIQGLDALLQLLDLRFQCRNGLLILLNPGVQSLDLASELLGFILSLVNLFLAVLELLVVILLLGLQVGHHLVDHANDLVEPALLSVQRHHHQIHLRVAVCLAQHFKGAAADLGAGARNLQKAGRRNRLFEKLQSIVRVQHLNGVRNRNQLLGPRFLDLLIILSLLFTISSQTRQKFLIRRQCLLGLLQVVLLLHHLDRQVTSAGGLVFNGISGSRNLAVLGCNHTVVSSR